MTKFVFEPARAYLEMARALHHVPVLLPEGTASSGVTMTNNTMLALLAHGYVFSFMAITDFVSGHLWKIWELPNSLLKSKYPKANDFTHLLKRELRETKDCITELCIQLKIEPLHEANPKLWNDLLQILKVTRDFLTHPRPDAVEFDTIVGDTIERHSWGLPAQIAEQVIRYFYVAQKQKAPGWLKSNKEFRIGAIRALSVQRRKVVNPE